MGFILAISTQREWVPLSGTLRILGHSGGLCLEGTWEDCSWGVSWWGERWARLKWVPPFSLLQSSLSSPALTSCTRPCLCGWWSFHWTACSSPSGTLHLLCSLLQTICSLTGVRPALGPWSLEPFLPADVACCGSSCAQHSFPLLPHCVGRALPSEASFAPQSKIWVSLSAPLV